MDEFISTLIKEVNTFLEEIFAHEKELYQISDAETLPIFIQIGDIVIIIDEYSIHDFGGRLFYDLDCNYSIKNKFTTFTAHFHGLTLDGLIDTFKHFLFQLILQEKL